MAGNISATYEVNCCHTNCTEKYKLKDERLFVSPAVAVDFTAIIKDRGWSLSDSGWKCPFHATVDDRQIALPI